MIGSTNYFCCHCSKWWISDLELYFPIIFRGEKYSFNGVWTLLKCVGAIPCWVRAFCTETSPSIAILKYFLTCFSSRFNSRGCNDISPLRLLLVRFFDSAAVFAYELSVERLLLASLLLICPVNLSMRKVRCRKVFLELNSSSRKDIFWGSSSLSSCLLSVDFGTYLTFLSLQCSISLFIFSSSSCLYLVTISS